MVSEQDVELQLAQSWWVESEASPSKQPPGEGYAASDDNRCFLIDGGGGETSGACRSLW